MENTEQELKELARTDTFLFKCAPDRACFNECCRDLNQFLTPYDILRLKRRFNMTSEAFLEQYTMRHVGMETGLPIITLIFNYQKEKSCPFLTPQGCSVYEDRPSSCRMYPLARLLTRSRETGETTERFFIVKEPHCLGFSGRSYTPIQWISDQKLEPYNEMNDLLMEIISLKNRLRPGPLDQESKDLFSLVCYDIDNFKKKAAEEGLFPELGGWNKEATAWSLEEETELLRKGLVWLKQKLFGNQ